MLFLYVQINLSVQWVYLKKKKGKQDLERISNTKALESKPVSIAKQKAEVYLNSHWTDSVGEINIPFKLIFPSSQTDCNLNVL